MPIFKGFRMLNKGLRYKLLLAFALMSIIPLLACVYIISSYAAPFTEDLPSTSTIVVIALLISVLGFCLARGLVDPVIEMAIEAKIIASGEYDHAIAINRDDEIGNLAVSINSMTQKIKLNLDEIKGYGQRMKEVNVEIHKKVLALSSLLQLGDIISTGSTQLSLLLDIAVEKVSAVFDMSFGIVFTAKEGGDEFVARASFNAANERLMTLVLKRGGKEMVERAITASGMLVVDKATRSSRDVEQCKASYGVQNLLAIPLASGKRVFGLLVVGSRAEEYKFKADDIDLAKVFVKQMTIAIESDMLSKKTEQLLIKDELTDLYNKGFLMSRLEEEIKRAIFYQRPCSLVVVNIDHFTKFRDEHGEISGEEVLRNLGRLIRDNMIPVGKVARTGADEFAMLLPEKNKREAAYIAEELRKKVESANLLREERVQITISGGVSENPIDGSTADELMKKAVEYCKTAKRLGKNRVVA